MRDNLLLIDVRRKLQTQDIFRAKTVKSLVAEIDNLVAQVDAANTKLARLEAERAAIQELAKQWRLAGAGRYQEQDGPTYTLLSALAGCADALADILKDQP